MRPTTAENILRLLLVRPSFHGNNGLTRAESVFVVARMLFWNANTGEGTQETARNTSQRSTAQNSSQRACCNHGANTGDKERCCRACRTTHHAARDNAGPVLF